MSAASKRLIGCVAIIAFLTSRTIARAITFTQRRFLALVRFSPRTSLSTFSATTENALAPAAAGRLELLRETLKACHDHYAHVFSRFTALDTKAQGTATIAGLQMAATLAFVPQQVFTRLVGEWGAVVTVLVGVLVLLALCSISFAVVALKIRTEYVPYRSDALYQSTRDLLAVPLVSSRAVERHYLQQIASWQGSLNGIGVSVNRKARLVWRAQACLLGAGICVATFVTLVLVAVATIGTPSSP